jgi:hypothetical protein
MCELRGAAHRGGADVVAATADSSGSGGAPTTAVDQRRGGRTGAPHAAEEEEKTEGKKGRGGPFIPVHGGGGRTDGRCYMAARSGRGDWRCTRATLSAGSGPAAAGADGWRLRTWPMLNRGEAGLTGGPDTVPGARGQIRFKPFQKFKLFQKQSNFSKYE